MGVDTCKWCERQGLNLQNIHTAHITQQQQKPNNLIERAAEYLNRHFSKENIQMATTWKDAQHY